DCISWIRQALQALGESERRRGRRDSSIGDGEGCSDALCDEKCDKGRFSWEGDWDISKVPTYDLIEECETTP
ncbi:hypothetical protein EV363DRAFT_1178782, partial [Boletus edulis]